MAGQILLIFLEGLVSFPAFAALPPDRPLGWALLGLGLALLLVGGWIVFRGISDLGSNLSARPAPVPSSTLIDTGIYRRVRHPIYAGVIVLGIGWALFVGSLAALVVAGLLAVWLDLKSRREEVWLLAHHPGYAAYRERTSRFFPGRY